MYMEQFLKLLLIGILSYWALSIKVQGWQIRSSDFRHVFALNQIAMRMLTNCYMDSETLVIHGDSDVLTINSLSALESFAMIMFSNSSMINISVEHRSKVNLFLMTSKTDKQLQEMLRTLKYSLWWNIMGSFFILDTSNKGCNNVLDTLKEAWKMNLITLFLLCIDSNEIPMVYTYNPYSNRAPELWNKIQSCIVRRDGWTVYALRHHAEIICADLNFDRTKYLDGSVIRIVANVPKYYTWIPDKYYDESAMKTMMYQQDAKTAEAMKYSLNATLVFNADERGFNTTEEPQGFYKRLRNGSSDVAMCLRNPNEVYNFTITYPLQYSAYHIATNNRGYYTPLEKIQKFYGTVTLISLCIIISMTFSVILLSGKKRRWAFAAFEIIRLLVNASLQTQINTLALRIFFAMVFLYFLIIHATFQGHLPAFLMNEEYRENVQILEDLRDSRYNAIYVGPSTVSLITDPLLEKKLVIGHPHCAPRIVGNDFAACINDIIFLVKPAYEHKLHLSKHEISTNVYVYTTRDDWPLKSRVDIFLMWFEQSGIAGKLSKGYVEQEILRHTIIMETSKVNDRSVSLSMLGFAFNIWMIGLLCAIICFILERHITNNVYLFQQKRNNPTE